MKFALTIELGCDVTRTYEDIVGALKVLTVDRLGGESGTANVPNGGDVYDDHDNKVGEWKVQR